MALRHRKPTSPGRRFQTVSDFADVTKDAPEKSLLAPKPKTGGRNNYGRKTSRHRGGGHKQQYRVVDFKRNKDGVPATVASIEYDPNRTCRIAHLHYLDGEKRYILAPNGLKVDDMVESGPKADIRTGNSLPMRFIPTGSTVHNVELRPGGGGKMARSAGMGVQIVAKEGAYATLRLPSTEMRRVPIDCRATLGVVGNSEHELTSIGKAGRNRWKGIRPPAPVVSPCQTRSTTRSVVAKARPRVGATRSPRGGSPKVVRACRRHPDKLTIRRRRGRGARS